MKILFLVESYFPCTSGVPVVVQYLAEGLANKGYYVSVCTKLIERVPRKEDINGVHVYRFNLRKTMLKKYVGEIEEYKNFVISSGADAVIFECSECITTDVLLKDLHKIKGKKIFHSHGFAGMKLRLLKWNVNLKYTFGNTYNWLRFKWYYGVIFKRYVKKFDTTLCLSEIDSSKRWLEKHARNVTVLQNAVDDMFCQPTKPVVYEPITKLGKPYFVSVATYSKSKNQIGIVREFFKLKTNCALVFIGPRKTEYYSYLLKEIDKLNSEYGKQNIQTLVEVPRSHIPDIIGNSALYLVGSTFEEYSISLIETMTKGVPFISTNVGNARILPGGVTINKITEMHTAIENLINDKDRYKKLSKEGQDFVAKNCRRSKAILLLENIINKV